MPYVNGEWVTDEEYEQRGRRDEYPDAVQDPEGMSWDRENNQWATTNSSSGGSDSYDAESAIKDLESRWNLNDSNRSSDIANLAGKNPEDRGAYLAQLSEQYRNRAASDAPARSGGGGGGGQSNFSGGGGGGNSYNEMASWLGDAFKESLSRQEALLAQMWEAAQAREAAIAAQEAERKTRADNLYNTYLGRAQQALNINANDPIIKGQVDAFRAEQERSRRDLMSDLAESRGPLTNLRGEQRMAAESVGQDVSAMQAALLARELGTKRDEVSNALASMGGMLSADQQAGLSRELSNIDNQLSQVAQQGGLTGQLGQLGLGYSGLGLDQLRMQLLNQQFYDQLRSQEDMFRGRLGFDYSVTPPWWER